MREASGGATTVTSYTELGQDALVSSATPDSSPDVQNIGLLVMDTDKPAAPAHHPALVHVALATVRLLLAGLAITGSIGVHYIPPLLYSTGRLWLATPLIFIGAQWIFKEDCVAFGRRLRLAVSELMSANPSDIEARQDFIGIAKLAVLTELAHLTLFIALMLTPVNNVAVLMNLAPIFTVALSIAVRAERASSWKVVGILGSTLGCLIVVNPSKASLNHNMGGFIGDMLIVANCVIDAVFLVVQKPISVRVKPVTLTFWEYLMALCMSTVVSLIAWISSPVFRFSPAATPAPAWLALLYAGVLGSAVPYIMVTWCMRVAQSPTMLAGYSTLGPIFTAGAEYLIRGTVPSLALIEGGVLIILGLAAVIYAKVLDDRHDRTVAMLAPTTAGSGTIGETIPRLSAEDEAEAVVESPLMQHADALLARVANASAEDEGVPIMASSDACLDLSAPAAPAGQAKEAGGVDARSQQSGSRQSSDTTPSMADLDDL